jgi:hypothetical protein
MTVYVMREGSNPNSVAVVATTGTSSNNINFNCPTNPFIHNSVSATVGYVCAEIRSGDSTPTTIIKKTTGAYATYNENLETTAGYRVKCDNANGDGQLHAYSDLATQDYFILLYADDNTQHHFAKITEVKTDDVLGDALEFEPKLGNEIPKGTKFSVFQGPTVSDTDVVAISLGMLVDSNTIHFDSLVCARPLFYFYNDRLDKPNELDHNKKYKLCYNEGTGTTFALNTISTFITSQDFGLKLKDGSKYGLNISITDNRRSNDDPRLHSTFYNVYDNIATFNIADYDGVFRNSKRESNDDSLAEEFNGEYQYIHYENSPQKMNNPEGLFYSKVFNSIGGRGGYAQAKLVEPSRHFSSKFNTQDRLAIREKLHENNLEDWFELPMLVDSTSGTISVYVTIEEGYDARVLFGQYEEIKIGDYIGTITGVGAPNYSTKLQLLTLHNNWRLATDSTYTLYPTLSFVSADDKVYRRAWSPATRTLMTTFPLQTEVTYSISAITDHPISVDAPTFKVNDITLGSYTQSRLYNSYVVFGAKNYEVVESRVAFDDKVHSCLRLEPPRAHYRSVADSRTSFDYAFSSYVLEMEIFTGTIEDIQMYLDNGQPIFEVAGRDNFAKLISPIVNKNTLFAQDMILSSKSPVQKLIKIGSVGGDVYPTIYYGPNTSVFWLKSADGTTTYAAPTNLYAGDFIFTANGSLVGVVESVSGSTIYLTFNTVAGMAATDILYKQSPTTYSFLKASQASALNSQTYSSLDGASNKGVFFTSGITLDSAGNKNTLLTGSSSNTNENAVGYHINSINKIADKGFIANLKDEFGGNVLSDTMVNALVDFNVVSINTEDTQTTIELATKQPLFLGRVEDYHGNDVTTTYIVNVISNTSNNRNYFTTNATSIDIHFKRNDPVFIKNGSVSFLGYFIRGTPDPTGSDHRIYLDRPVSVTTGDEIHKLNTQTRTGMYFINKPNHLIQLANSHIDNTYGTMPFNTNIHDTATSTITTDYLSRYGASYYHIVDLEKGQYDYFNEKPRLITTTEQSDAMYYNKNSKTNYFATSSRFNLGYISTIDITNADEDDFTTLPSKQGMFEKRGNLPSRGTNFHDYYLTGDTDEGSIHLHTLNDSRLWENAIHQQDSKVSRNFLFIGSDLLPYSSLRKDSLQKTNRDLTDFNIMLSGNGSESNISQAQTKYLGGGTSISTNDDNITFAQISSAPDISTLKRFSILRLIEMTVDWHFNSFDVEHPPPKDKSIDLIGDNKINTISKVLDSGGSAITITSYTSSPNTIVISATAILEAVDYNIYSASGFLIGQAVSASNVGWTSPITLVAAPNNNEVYAQTTGIEIYAIRTNAQNLTLGSHVTDSIIDKELGKLNFLKGSVMNNQFDEGYGGDLTDEYNLAFLEDGDLSIREQFFSYKHTLDISLPPLFQSIDATLTNVTFSGGDVVVEPASVENTTTIEVQATPNNLTTNVQYELYTALGYYLGRTTIPQTYNSVIINMDISYFKDDSASAVRTFNERKLLFAEKPNQSLISTYGNTHISEVMRTLAKRTERKLYNETLCVMLDRYSIENGGQASVSKGLVSSQIEEAIQVGAKFTSQQPNKIMLRRQDYCGFANYTSPAQSLSGDGATPYLADGAYMAFKPYLVFTDKVPTTIYTSATTISASGGDLKKYTFEVDTKNGTSTAQTTNMWLNFAPNLTGTYLVSCEGIPYGVNTTTNKDDYESTDTGAHTSLRSFADQIPKNMHYVVSHTITRVASITTHEIVIDNASSISKAYKVMRVAENTFYANTPTNIKLYTPSAEYTKQSYSDEMYSDLKSYRFKNSKGPRDIEEQKRGTTTPVNLKTYSETGFNEGISSMYVIADTDSMGTGNYLVYRNPTAFFGQFTDGDSFSMALSSNETTIKTQMGIEYDSTNNIGELKFSKLDNLVGVVSAGEIFTITTTENIKGKYTKANIGNTVNICYETEELLNDLFEDEGLTYTTQDSTEYPLFISPEYKGTDLMSAANFLLERKNKRLLYDNGFFIRDDDSALHRPNVFIDEQNTNYNIKSVEKGENIFDTFNEVIVYGRNVKAIRKNLKSIKKIGKKSLELMDNNLYTQYDAERRASKLLRLHSRQSEKIVIEVLGDEIYLIKPADIITLEIPSQHITRSEYLVLEQEYTIDGFTKLVLGEYSKGLEDRFAELLSENKKINSSIRPKTFKEPSKSSDFYESFKIKEIRLKIRKRTSSGSGATLGFGSTMGFTTKMGFTGGSTVTYVDLIEEEL